MLETGWVTDDKLPAGGGTYCLRCAHLLLIVRLTEHCAWCEAPMVDESTAEERGWAYFADELGELHPCCPGCLGEQFGIADRFRLRGAL
jgi:hypothetical protein